MLFYVASAMHYAR